jgi:hypothetical protein
MAHPAIKPATPGAAHPRTPPERRTEEKHRDSSAGANTAAAEDADINDANAINKADGSTANASAKDTRDAKGNVNPDHTSALAAAAAVFESVEDATSKSKSKSKSNLNPRLNSNSDLNSDPRPSPCPDSSTLPLSSQIPSYNPSFFLDPPTAHSRIPDTCFNPYLGPNFANPANSNTNASPTIPERGRSRVRGYYASDFVTALGAVEGKEEEEGVGGKEKRGGERNTEGPAGAVGEKEKERIGEREGEKKREDAVQTVNVNRAEKEKEKKEKKKMAGEKNKQDRTCVRAVRRFWVWMWEE